MQEPLIQPVILAGGPQKLPFERATDMSVLEFPLRPDTGTLKIWNQVLARHEAVRDEIFAVVSDPAQAKQIAALANSERSRVVVDPRTHRGTGGVLSDLFGDGGVVPVECDYLLLIERTACPLKDLDRLMETLDTRPDIVIGISEHDRLAGLIAIRPEVLGLVPAIGYSDLKEQVVASALSSGMDVEACVLVEEAVTIDDLRGALQAVERWCDKTEVASNSSATKVRGACSLHPSAQIEGATIIDSVCLEGAIVAPGSVVARSILGRWANVPQNTTVVDAIVGFDTQ